MCFKKNMFYMLEKRNHVLNLVLSDWIFCIWNNDETTFFASQFRPNFAEPVFVLSSFELLEQEQKQKRIQIIKNNTVEKFA